MKQSILALLATTAISTAGPLEFAPADPGPGPSSGLLENFFLGASFGSLQESEDEMWLLQLGVDLRPTLAGISQALFLEVGYNELEFFNIKEEIIPLTLNYKLERPLFGALNLYAGAGVSFYDVSGAVSA